MKKKSLSLLFLLSSLFSMAQTVVSDATINAGETFIMSAGTEYLLDGYVYVEEGATLIVDPGVIVKGLTVPSNGDLASALVIARGARILAEGTAANPIIFTGELDDLSITTDLTAADNNTWGGLIILGNAIVGDDGGTDVIEGLPAGADDARNIYGGTDQADNSGILTYVSIRHGGSDIGADNEINGLTLGGVGNGTTIDFIEVFANQDDGIELFGGSVNITHAVVSFVGDDSYDMDESWAGFIQFAVALQGTADGLGDNAIEYDGSEETDKNPNSTGRIYNGTFIGAGAGAANSKSTGLRLKDDGNVQIWNSIFLDQIGSVYRFDNDAGTAAIAANIAFGFQGDLVTGTVPSSFDVEQVDPQLASISRTPNQMLDPRPVLGSIALSGAAATSEGEATAYRGAFDGTTNWALGWTAMDTYGYFGDRLPLPGTGEIVVVTDADINAGEEFIMTADKQYVLDGYVYVEEGACLTIEPGTVVRGAIIPSNGVDFTSALIITRGARIKAEGTAANPIIFTNELDDINDPSDFTAVDNNTWGGLIILGNAIISDDGGTDVIEGLPSGSDDPRNIYGGTDQGDDSGILRYVSIRHGGSDIGADNEINGLTLGGVGNGTVIDYIEVFANQDDGIELFGGSVNVTHAVVGFVGDDSYDVDESWTGYIQFALSVQGENDGGGDNAIEYDGSEATTKEPNEAGRIYNGTFIGAGVGSANTKATGLRLKDDGNVQIWNSIFMDQVGPAYRFDDDAGEATIAGNIAFGVGTLIQGPIPTEGFDVLQEDPALGGISRVPNNGLDPRPTAGSPALGTAVATTEGEAVTYKGAFSNDTNWALSWTAMDAHGYFGNITTVSTIDFGIAENGIKLNVPNPNPVRENFATISFELPDLSEHVQLRIYDITGQLRNQLDLGTQFSGEHQYTLNVGNYSNGTYIMVLTTANSGVSQKLIISK